ncbi:MAG: 3-oxoacyl-ACP reductase [Dehalococcoidia bacterium]|nr:3-oxoacyl-ACP reductase [Dehalococcoidia bacterium]
MQRFSDRVAMVTGAATGIGFGIARRLGSEGARVSVVDLDEAGGHRAVEALATEGVTAHLAVADVSDESSVSAAVEQVMEACGRIDILVNNAGIAGRAAPLWELSAADLDRVYRTNLRGVFVCCRYVIPHMLASDYGRIVNIASIAGKEGNPRVVPYSATKAGVIGLTKALGKELAETGVRVNCITPAVVRTAILDQTDDAMVEYMIGRIPMKRTGQIEEIAALVAWIASEECSFSTGAVFDISGGRATY